MQRIEHTRVFVGWAKAAWRSEAAVPTKGGHAGCASLRPRSPPYKNYSIETPLARIGPAHLSISLRMNLPRYSGERCSGEATVLPRRL